MDINFEDTVSEVHSNSLFFENKLQDSNSPSIATEKEQTRGAIEQLEKFFDYNFTQSQETKKKRKFDTVFLKDLSEKLLKIIIKINNENQVLDNRISRLLVSLARFHRIIHSYEVDGEWSQLYLHYD
jgi:hypothetical protein